MTDDATQAPPDVAPAAVLDLDAITADLAGVEIALARLEAGTYFTDEVTGAPLPEQFLVANPTARTVAGATTA
jgi:RNA polymerase-binding transcription factor DksA